LKSTGKILLADYEPFIGRGVDLSAMARLSTSLFFDGAYVSSLVENFNANISGIIDEFNSMSKKTYSNVEFIEKKLDVSLKLLKSSPVDETNFRFLTN
jgi:hypothetical protein